jgi:hypothetical protein
VWVLFSMPIYSGSLLVLLLRILFSQSATELIQKWRGEIYMEFNAHRSKIISSTCKTNIIYFNYSLGVRSHYIWCYVE